MFIIAIELYLTDYRLLSGISMPFWSGKSYLQFSGIRGLCFTTSNSTWIADDRPCITYGLRGVVHSVLEVSVFY